jgi:hypothetical protein
MTKGRNQEKKKKGQTCSVMRLLGVLVSLTNNAAFTPYRMRKKKREGHRMRKKREGENTERGRREKERKYRMRKKREGENTE